LAVRLRPDERQAGIDVTRCGIYSGIPLTRGCLPRSNSRVADGSANRRIRNGGR
jgi:hypothetical protein